MNRLTSWTWDKLNRMTQETLPDPDGAGPLTSPVITIGYDALSRKTSEQDPLGTTTWAYANTDTGQVTSMTLPDPDGSGPLTSPVWAYSYDTLGRQYQTTDPMNHAQTTSFDADGRTTSVLDNLGHGPTYAYGHGGELLTTTDALSYTTTEQYDSRFRLVQTTDPNGGVTQIQLDPAGNRVGLIDPDNNKTTFVFDPLNRETSETNALNFTRSFGYDASSDLTSETDRDGRVRDWVFDNLHRETAENWMNGNTVVYAINTAYDADNEITSQSDPDSSYAFALDNLGRTLTVDNSGTPSVPHVVLTSGYDAGNDRTSLSATINGTADFLNNYTFDADQRLTDETQTGQNGGNGVDPKQIELQYNALGQFTSVARYNFVGVGPMVDVATGAFSYDTGNRLTGLDYTYGGGGHAIDAYSWTLDNADRVTSVNATVDGTANYGYDPTDQLTSATYTGTNAPPNAPYSYTKNGNRTMSGYTNGTGNELTSDGTFNYGFDGEGNRTLRTRISNSPANDYQTKFFYDYRNRLTDEEYFNNSGTLTKHVHYVYDTLDREIGKQVDDTGGGTYDRTERYTFDGGSPVAQFDGSGNLTMRDFNGPSAAGVDALMAQEPIVTQGQAGSSDWDLTDNLGTLRYMVSDASAVVDHVITDAFGDTTSESNTSVSHWTGFAGGHADPDTHDVLNGERRYDSGTGAWQTKDPIGLAGGDPNAARYGGNNPTNNIDPSGLQAEAPPNNGDELVTEEDEAEEAVVEAQTPRPIIQIFVDQNTAPLTFNSSTVQSHMQQMLATAGVQVQLNVQMTTNSPAQLNLGTINYPGSYFYNQPWYGWVSPLSYIVNTFHDVCYYPFASSTLSYTHYVHFSNTALGNSIAMTGGSHQTTVNPRNIQNAVGVNANMSLIYANILAHEVFYLAIMGHFDDLNAPPGSLPSNTASSHQLLSLTAEEAEELADEMDAEHTAPEEGEPQAE